MWELLLALSDHHLPGEFNEVHPGIRYESQEAPYMGAFFMNSEGNPSLALGLHGEIPLTNSLDLFGEIGGATGYTGGAVVPFGRAGIEYDNKLRLFVAPGMNADTGDIGPVLGFENILMRF